jgi:hypothetical protein
VLAALRSMTDEALGIDAGLMQRALFAFSIPPSARVSPASSQGTFHRLFDVDAGAGGCEARPERVAFLRQHFELFGQQRIGALQLLMPDQQAFDTLRDLLDLVCTGHTGAIVGFSGKRRP